MLTRSQGSFDEILSESDAIVELIGGIEPAREYVLAALVAGKPSSPPTSSCSRSTATSCSPRRAAGGAQLRYEAAVAGVVPAIRAIRESLAGTHVEKVYGIVNGTTNYILTEMASTGEVFAEALARAQELGYAEADPTEDVNGADAAAKMAILARLAFHTSVSLDDVEYEGIEEVTPDDLDYAKEFGLVLKLLGVAERRDGGISVRVFPAFLYGGHPLAPVVGPFNAVTLEGPAITEVTLSGPGAGGPQTASAVLGDLVSVMADAGMDLQAGEQLRQIPGDQIESAFYLHLEVADEPGVLAQIAQILGAHGASVKSVVQRGRDEEASLIMVIHPVAEGAFNKAVGEIAKLDVMRSAPTADSRDRGGVHGVNSRTATAGRIPLIERYRDRLPIEPGWEIVSLLEGSTPLVSAPRLSERLGIETLLKFDGMNPTGSFKDRGMTMAVTAAKAKGAEAIICASTGNTAASAAAYAARAGLRGAVIVPEGKIAAGKLAQSLMHGARVVGLDGNFDEALELVKQLVAKHPVELVNSINPYRIEGQKTAAFEVVDELGRAPDALAIPVGNAGNITAWWKGFKRVRSRDAGAARLPGRRRRADRQRRDRREPGDGRLGDPDRQPGPLAGGGRGRRRERRPRSPRSATSRSSRRSAGWRPTRACSASRRRRPRWPERWHTVSRARRLVCVITGHGLKDPDTAIEQSPGVIHCDVDLGQIERAVLGD